MISVAPPVSSKLKGWQPVLQWLYISTLGSSDGGQKHKVALTVSSHTSPASLQAVGCCASA